ncbi:MAG: FtsQ-type POTRA domain-containing protein [Clostridia bacterium]|nr:FtsQ-type POTRA domain-containing protein [Clostridia bacterium]MBQ3091630.1 FtsQ-type POTRA domain-containing protein [Clostridia bacterium]
MSRKTKSMAKRNRKRRTRSFSFATSFICLALVLSALVSAAVIFFKIGEVRVVGETPYSDAEIIEASGLQQGDSMFLFNKFASINRIFYQCPYIETIQMKRTLPDVLSIIVTPCTEAAVIYSNGGWYVIDGSGKILAKTTAAKAEALPKVTGGELENPEVGKMAKFFDEESEKALFSVLNTAKNNDILSYIGDIDITKVYDIHFDYMERFTVYVGTGDDLERKFKFVDAVIAALGPNDRGSIDVSDGKTGYFSQSNVKY